MSQMRLLPPPGEVRVEFFGHKLRAVIVDGVSWIPAVEVAALLGLDGHGGQVTRSVPDDEKGVHSMDTIKGPQQIQCVTLEGAVIMALSRRRGASDEMRKKLANAITQAVSAAPAIPSPEVTALSAKVDQVLFALGQLSARLDAQPAAQVDDVARAVAVALEAYDAAAWKRRSDAIKAGQAARGRVPPPPSKPRLPALTEADVLRALRAERGPVGADVLAARYRWRRSAVRELLARMGDAGRVRYVRGRNLHGWEIVPEVV